MSPTKRNLASASSGAVSKKAQIKMNPMSSGTGSSSSRTSTKKPLKPLVSIARPPRFDFGTTHPSPTTPAATLSKGRREEKTWQSETGEVVDLTSDCENDKGSHILEGGRLWVDQYEPQTEAELAVHKRKVENVRQWFEEALHGGMNGKLRKYRRVLVLTGPAGTAKTTTVRVLAREMGFQICEWSNAQEERILDSANGGEYQREGITRKFDTFLSRAASSIPLLSSSVSSHASSQTATSSRISGPSSFPAASNLKHSERDPKPQVILLEDLPNVLHGPTQEAFHDALTSYVNASSNSPLSAPLVVIISDASVRAETRDERIFSGSGGRGRDTIDVRSVIPPGLLNGPYVTQISFNPIAPTLMTRALTELLDRHYGSSTSRNVARPSKTQIDLIVEMSNGDIRSAIMALEFACSFASSQSSSSGSTSRAKSGKKRKVGTGSRQLFESVTRREDSLHLFHLLGKVLYNKRKGDDPPSSSTARDRARQAELDRALNIPSPLPSWLESEHGRRASRVDVDDLYADSPIDSGLFGLYIHQNYPQFCDGLEQVVQLSEWLSAIDASGGEHWYQANPHTFHLLALSTLHSLPSPVPRRNQKMYKPEYFESLRKLREAEDALGDIWTWFQSRVASEALEGGGRHGKSEIVLEMGKVLKLMGRVGGNETMLPVPLHTLFSSFVFSRSSDLPGALDEDDDASQDDDKGDESLTNVRMTIAAVDGNSGEIGREGAYLSSDEIEEFPC